MGKIIIISISKIKKITAIKKKWIENGKRLLDIGLNPHSNGFLFCTSVMDFFLINEIRDVITINNNKIKIINKNKELITQFFKDHLSWKLNILYILIELFPSSINWNI